jgi:hypothetical protein
MENEIIALEPCTGPNHIVGTIEAHPFVDPLYTPSQAAQFSGVSVNLQRTWRRRGFISKHKQTGHARLSLIDLAALTFMRILSEGGLPPILIAGSSYESAKFFIELYASRHLAFKDARQNNSKLKVNCGAIEFFANVSELKFLDLIQLDTPKQIS